MDFLIADGLFDFNKRKVIVIVGAIVLLLCSNALHEAGHAFVAWWSGDKRIEIRRRMTLNPINHIHPVLTIILPIVTYILLQIPMGGARPVMVDAEKIGPRRMALVAIAGPLGNAIFVVLCAVVTAALMAFDVIDEVNAIGSPYFAVLILSVWFSVFLVALNLVPLPPADGSRIAGMFMSDRVRAVYYKLAPLTVIILIGLTLWVTGNLARFDLGRGYPHVFEQTRTWVEDQVFALTGIIRRLRGS